MARLDPPGSFEQLVLLAAIRLGEGAYGMAVRREIEARTGRPISIGAVYATLERLEAKGLVERHEAPGGVERGGRARRFVRVRGEGREALARSLAALDRMRCDLAGELGLAGGDR